MAAAILSSNLVPETLLRGALEFLSHDVLRGPREQRATGNEAEATTMKFWFTLAIALSSMSSIPAIAQQRQQSAPSTQPQFSQPRPKTPRVAAGCLSPGCW